MSDQYSKGNTVINATTGQTALNTILYGASANGGSVFPTTAFGDLLVAQFSPETAWRHDYGIINRLVSTTGTANGGTVTVDASRAKLSTSVAVNGIARMQTIRPLRYMPGVGGLARFTAVFATPKANTTQYVGIGDTVDAFYFGYNGTTFVVGRRRGGSDTQVAQASWNGTVPAGLSYQLGNIFQIRFQWLGYGYIRFYILDPNGQDNGYALVHTINYPNTSALTHILNPTLPLFAEIANTGNNTDMVMYSPSAVAGTEGNVHVGFHNPLDVWNTVDAVATYSDVNNNHFITIQNKSTFNTLANRIPVYVKSIELSRGSGGSNGATIRFYENATTAGVRTYNDVDTNNSPVATSVTATTITGGTVTRTYSMPSSRTGIQLEFEDGEIVILPGSTLTIAVQDSQVAGTDFTVNVNWQELF